jgi:hypothetical protein
MCTHQLLGRELSGSSSTVLPSSRASVEDNAKMLVIAIGTHDSYN